MTVGGEEIVLSALELRLLGALLAADGRVLTRDQLLDAIHGEGEGDVTDRAIDQYVKRLREKLGDDPAEPRYVATVRGAGYGGAAGLLAGLVAVVVTPIGLTLAGAAAMTVAGAMVGCWASALVGSSLPDPIRAKFDAEIKAGNILVVVDGDKPLLDAATPAMTGAGGR